MTLILIDGNNRDKMSTSFFNYEVFKFVKQIPDSDFSR